MLAGEKCMPELYLRQPVFTDIACRPFTKHCERIQKFRETGHLKQNELDKACFPHNPAHILTEKICLKELFQIKF